MRSRLALLFALALTLFAVVATAAGTSLTSEVLVQTTPTLIPRLRPSKGFELQNNGPNNICCALGSDMTDGGGPGYPDGGSALLAGICRVIAAGSSWSGSVAGEQQVYCTAASANQSHGAATILTEAP